MSSENKRIWRLIKFAIILIIIWFICFGIMLCLISCVKVDNDKDNIYWSYNRNLKISDFVLVDELPNGVSASSCTGILMVIVDSVPYGYQAVAVFDRSKSKWSRKVKNPSVILAHEQLHFDITQYMTQELNQEMRYCMCPRESAKMYYQYQTRLDSMQKLYDSETNYSRNEVIQQQWNVKLFRLLRKDVARN